MVESKVPNSSLHSIGLVVSSFDTGLTFYSRAGLNEDYKIGQVHRQW